MKRLLLTLSVFGLFGCENGAGTEEDAKRLGLDSAVKIAAAAQHETGQNGAKKAAPEFLATNALGTPYIPPQCYTKTKDESGRVHNPCFTCHVDSRAPNYVNDSSFQTSYEFGPRSRKNPWTNLFVDRTAEVAAQSDEEILVYVRRDNYHGEGSDRGLVARLKASGAEWDVDGDGKWSGWLPDIQFQFDAEGFDEAPDGLDSGWRAYAYYPLQGTFWPTNGSFGDAAIRLAPPFREDRTGKSDRSVYKTNLAIVEALIQRRDIKIESTDEVALGVDLDGDGKLGTARQVRFRWKNGNDGMSFVGRAALLQAQGELHLAAGLYPEGTEFAHSVRYLDVADGKARMAVRMKELRYMVKRSWLSYGDFEQQALSEANEKAASPERTRPMVGSAEKGIGNRAGWAIQGFIEDAEGALRPQTIQEQAFCIGCHSGIGATDDSIFSFGRKLLEDSPDRGWFHWSKRGLEGMAEPVRADGRGEYSLYLEINGAGDELRSNEEVRAKFFFGEKLNRAALTELQRDVTTLLLPSPKRALTLDKAYRVIVREQSFTKGRDATVRPVKNVHKELPEEPQETGVTEVISERRKVAVGASGSP